ncbi:unnamed protein product [Parajaminaea phylloscopi]
MLAPAARTALRATSARNAASRLAVAPSHRTLATAPPSSPTPPKGNQPQKPEEPAASEPSSSSSSTDAEGSSARNRSSSAFDIDTTLATIAEDAAQDAAKGPKGRTGATSRGKRGNTSGRSGLWMQALGLVAVGLGGAQLYQLSGDWRDEAERERFADDPAGESALGRIKLRIKAMYEDYNAPVWEKLLPDPLPFPYNRPYTLVVDLDDLLVHSNWTREHGWRTAKRPGLDTFLGYLSQFWEIVIYTSQPYYAVGPIIEKLDPDRRWIAYTLFRESCRTMPDGTIVKDLSRLNRDLSKVLVLDTKAESFSQYPENGIVVNKWDGNKQDRELAELLPFLEAIPIYTIADVRSTVKAYAGTHVPTEYNKRQLEIKQKEWADWQAKKASQGAGRGWLGGLVSSSPSPGPKEDGPPKTWFDAERERFRQGYAEDEKFWKENGEKLRKEAQEEQEKRMKDMKFSVLDLLSGKQFAQPPPQQ